HTLRTANRRLRTVDRKTVDCELQTPEAVMEVILREHVDNLGRRGDVVKVAAGYARNYLLPRKLALAVTDNNKRQIEREKKVAEVRDAEERGQADAIAQRLAQLEIEIA